MTRKKRVRAIRETVGRKCLAIVLYHFLTLLVGYVISHIINSCRRSVDLWLRYLYILWLLASYIPYSSIHYRKINFIIYLLYRNENGQKTLFRQIKGTKQDLITMDLWTRMQLRPNVSEKYWSCISSNSFQSHRFYVAISSQRDHTTVTIDNKILTCCE